MHERQMPLSLIDHESDGLAIPQRVTDGYINATALCQASGKLLGHYLANKNTQAFLEELSADIGIPISDLGIVTKGGNPRAQGTWMHPDIAVNLIARTFAGHPAAIEEVSGLEVRLDLAREWTRSVLLFNSSFYPFMLLTYLDRMKPGHAFFGPPLTSTRPASPNASGGWSTLAGRVGSRRVSIESFSRSLVPQPPFGSLFQSRAPSPSHRA